MKVLHLILMSGALLAVGMIANTQVAQGSLDNWTRVMRTLRLVERPSTLPSNSFGPASLEGFIPTPPENRIKPVMMEDWRVYAKKKPCVPNAAEQPKGLIRACVYIIDECKDKEKDYAECLQTECPYTECGPLFRCDKMQAGSDNQKKCHKDFGVCLKTSSDRQFACLKNGGYDECRGRKPTPPECVLTC